MVQLMTLKAAVVAWFSGIKDDERGASLVEYALLLALIAVVAIGALLILGQSVSHTLNTVSNAVNNA